MCSTSRRRTARMLSYRQTRHRLVWYSAVVYRNPDLCTQHCPQRTYPNIQPTTNPPSYLSSLSHASNQCRNAHAKEPSTTQARPQPPSESNVFISSWIPCLCRLAAFRNKGRTLCGRLEEQHIHKASTTNIRAILHLRSASQHRTHRQILHSKHSLCWTHNPYTKLRTKHHHDKRPHKMEWNHTGNTDKKNPAIPTAQKQAIQTNTSLAEKIHTSDQAVTPNKPYVGTKLDLVVAQLRPLTTPHTTLSANTDEKSPNESNVMLFYFTRPRDLLQKLFSLDLGTNILKTHAPE